MYTPLLFIDWYNTISTERFWESFVNPEVFSTIQENIFSDPEMVQAWMRGAHSSEEICAVLETHTGIRRQKLLRSLQRSCERLTHPQPILHLLKDLSDTHNIILVTDNMDCFSQWTVPILERLAIFKKISVSATIHTLKNDQGGILFSSLAKELQVPLSSCTLLDDSLSTRTIFFSWRNFHSYHLTSRYDDLVETTSERRALD